MAKFLDIFLSCVGIFFLAFCWVYYVLRETRVALILAVTLALCGGYVIFCLVTKRQNKIAVKTQRKNNLNALSNYLRFCEKLESLFCDLLGYYQFGIESVETEQIVAVKNNQKSLIALLFEDDVITKNEIRKAVVDAKKIKADKVIFFCNGVSATLKSLANEQLPCQFVDINNTYALFEQADKMPPLPKTKSKKSAYFCEYAFCKKRFGGYLGSAIFLFVTSALTFFPLYSILWATVLLALAFFSLLNKKYNVEKTCVTLE